jgi:hypothetical protein
MTRLILIWLALAMPALLIAAPAPALAYHHPAHMVFSFDYPRWCMPDMGKRYGFVRKPQCVNGAVAGIVRPVY